MWLLTNEVFQAMQAGIKAGLTHVDSATVAEFMAVDRVSGNRIMNRAGSTAEIQVQGVLTKEPDFFALLFGGGNTTYAEIAAAVEQADADPTLTKTTLRINSPGGSVVGMIGLADVIRNASNHTEAVADGLCASAAFTIGASANRFVAVDRGTLLGSVGIVTTAQIDDSSVDITSTEAPEKRPDASTEEGQALIRKRLDAIHAQMVDVIAKGRGVDVATVNESFGRGAVVTASQAIDMKMIDAIQTSEPAAESTAAQTKGDHSMTFEEFKAAHPELFAEAVTVGVNQERDRAKAHFKLAKSAGCEDAMSMAIEAVQSGEEATVETAVKYTEVAATAKVRQDRADDDNDTKGVADQASASQEVEPSAEDEETAVHNMILADGGDGEGVFDLDSLGEGE